MKIQNWLMNNMAFRNMLLLYGHTNNYSKHPGQFTPYFSYEIGFYHKESHLLYFPKTPHPEQYYNAIFLKLWAYNTHDAIKYLETHYHLYPDKNDFLLFLKRELQYRIDLFSRRKDHRWSIICRICLEWVEKELNGLYDAQKIQVYNQFIKNELTVIVKNELHNNPIADTGNGISGTDAMEKLATAITENLQKKLDSIVENTAGKMEQMAGQYDAGEIELANPLHRNKLITLFLCLRNLKSKARKKGMGAPLFTRMSSADIAKLLRLHIIPFKGYKADTIEKNIGTVNTELQTDDPAYMELDKALQKFFFN